MNYARRWFDGSNGFVWRVKCTVTSHATVRPLELDFTEGTKNSYRFGVLALRLGADVPDFCRREIIAYPVSYDVYIL